MNKPITEWYVEGVEYSNCNCDYSCPCQFEANPTHGSCRGFEVVHIERGRFATTPLDGLNVAVVYSWPGPIYRGGGALQAIVDVRTDAAQRAALEQVLLGEHTHEGATHWWVYRAMSQTVHPTLFRPIAAEIDIEKRSAKVEIDGVLKGACGPIKSPATGEVHRVRIDIPNGIEFEVAEIGSGSARVDCAMAFELRDSYGQFNRLRHSGQGVVHSK